MAFAFTTNHIFLIGIHILYGFFGIATLWSAYLVGIRGLGDESVQSKLFGFSEATRGSSRPFSALLFSRLWASRLLPFIGFKAMLIVGAVVTGIFLVLGLIFLPKTEKEEKTAVAAGDKVTVMDVIKNPGVWIIIIVLTCAYSCWTFGNGYLTTYTVRVGGLAESTASTLGIIRSYVIVFIAGFLGGWFLDKFTYKGKSLYRPSRHQRRRFCSDYVYQQCFGYLHFFLSHCSFAFIANIMKSTYWSLMGQAGIPAKMTALATGFISFIIFLPDVIFPTIFGSWITNAEAAGNVAAGFNSIFITLVIFAVVGVLWFHSSCQTHKIN